MSTDRDEVRLWPLGNMVGPSGMPQTPDHMLVALAGPAANLVIVVVTAIALNLVGARFVWNPFGNLPDSGAPALAAGNTVVLKPAEFTPLTALAFAEICR